MSYPEDSFRPRYRKPSDFVPIEEIPDPKTEEGYERDESYLADDDVDLPDDSPDHRRKVEEKPFAALEGVDHMPPEKLPRFDPHENLAESADRAADIEKRRRRSASMHPTTREQTQGRRGKEPRDKHQKGGDRLGDVR